MECGRLLVAVYNFEVEDFHTYYVSDNAILVHNYCGERGIGGKGWVGDKTWRDNINTVRTQQDVRTINGQVLSPNEANRLIDVAGGTYIRGPEISFEGTHTYWHIHYSYNKSYHTIEVFME